MKIAAVTPKIHLGDCEYNAGRIAEYAEKAAAEGCRLVVFPELVLTGSTCGDIPGNADFEKAAATALEKIREETAELKNLAIVFGAPFYRERTGAEDKAQKEDAGAVAKGDVPRKGKSYRSGIVLIKNGDLRYVNEGDLVEIDGKKMYFITGPANLKNKAELIEVDTTHASDKQKTLDFARLLHKPETEKALYWDRGAFTKVNGVKDEEIIKACQKALEDQEEITLDYAIKNTDRAVTTMLSGVIAKKYGEAGLPEGTINIKFKGAAGQSFGAFAVRGLNIRLEGECNDYFGKGLSGGRISILPPARSGEDFHAEENIIAGNTGLYGATSGELYVNGKVGERFGVRNSGAIAVIEGAGDHCCEYMTGGRVVVLGETGRNFAAGMSGGVAYVYDPKHTFDYFCNMDMVEIDLVEDSVSRKELLELVRQHYLHTGSQLAGRMLDDWSRYSEDFVQVVPIEYKRVLQEEQMNKLRQKIADMQRDY